MKIKLDVILPPPFTEVSLNIPISKYGIREFKPLPRIQLSELSDEEVEQLLKEYCQKVRDNIIQTRLKASSETPSEKMISWDNNKEDVCSYDG